MQKNIVLFSLIVTIIIVLNCNLVYSEPIKDNIDENIDINKNYKYITINNDYDKNIFVTNRVEELDKIMEKYVNDNDDDISDAEIARVM